MDGISAGIERVVPETCAFAQVENRVILRVAGAPRIIVQPALPLALLIPGQCELVLAQEFQARREGFFDWE